MKLAVLFAFAALGAAQSQAVLQGQVEGAPGTNLSNLTVRLKPTMSTASDYRSDVDLSGGFRFSGLKPGNYVLQVVDASGRELASQPVAVGYNDGSVSVPLPTANREAQGTGTVSMATLQHKPKAAAFKACRRAQRLAEKGDYTNAALELEKAVALDPDYAPAHGNLGAQYARLAHFDSAEAELKRAIELDPGTGVYYSNLAWVLANEGKEPAAEPVARRGVELDAVNPKAHMMLGLLLAKHAETVSAAVPHLVYAAREIPVAHRVLAAVYHANGNEKMAAEEMARYRAALEGPGKTPELGQTAEQAADPMANQTARALRKQP